MDTKQLLGAIVATIVKIAVAAAVIVVVFRLAIGAYNFGYSIFADIPVSSGEGRTVSVSVAENQDEKELSKMLEQKAIMCGAGAEEEQ